MRPLQVEERKARRATRYAAVVMAAACAAWGTATVRDAHCVRAMSIDESIRVLHAHPQLSKSQVKLAAIAVGLKIVDTLNDLQAIAASDGPAGIEAQACLARIKEALR